MGATSTSEPTDRQTKKKPDNVDELLNGVDLAATRRRAIRMEEPRQAVRLFYSNLERAQIILLLVSADFINSDYCYEKELQRALERHAEGSARVIPVIVRDVNWRSAPFANLQALPRGAKAVTKWPNRDTAWRNVSEGIEQVARQIRGSGGR